MTTLKLPRKFWPSAESLNAPNLLSFLLIPPSLNIYTADRNSFENFGGFPGKNVDGEYFEQSHWSQPFSLLKNDFIIDIFLKILKITWA